MVRLNRIRLFRLRFSRCHQPTPRCFSWWIKTHPRAADFGLIHWFSFAMMKRYFWKEKFFKRAKCNSLLSKFQFGEMIPFIMLDHMLCYFLNIICLELILKSNDQTKSNQIILWDHSLRSFIWIYMITFDPSVFVVVFAYFQGLIICSFKAWTLRWWPSPVL